MGMLGLALGHTMNRKKGFFLTLWGWLAHVSRAMWLYKLLAGFAVATVTFVKGFYASLPIAYLIPLTVVALGGTLYVINQITIMFNRFREGYSYGLAYEMLTLGFNPDNQGRDASIRRALS